jgi:PhoPQ-activated pathogenicity-related protein
MSAKKQVTKSSIIFIILVLALTQNCFAAETVMEQYVKQPDSAFQYELVKTVYDVIYTTYIFEITSQKWHPDEVEPGKWKHWLTIVEPRLLGEYTEYIPFFSLVRSDTALLYILRGDAEHKDRPSEASPQAVQLAISTHSITAEIHGIPIDPVAFLDEQPEKYGTIWCSDDNPFKKDEECELLRSEDSLQARSIDLALSTGDFTWALMAPMAKAVIRGMDVIQEFLQQRNLGRLVVNSFVLTGHSKRGHIAWLTGALDERVVGVAPVSYDLLNISEQIALQETSWPERSPEQDANEEFDLYTRYKTETGTRLIADTDPYAYRDRLTIPALILVGTGDPYSCSDSVNLYLNELPGETRIFYVPNAGHDIRELAEVENSIAAFYRHIINNQPMPEFSWNGLEEGLFTVTAGQQKPVAVKLWVATNPVNRDFRQPADNETAIQWTSTAIEDSGDGTYTGVVPPPETGYRAFYVELMYKDTKEGTSYSFATPITILGQ